MIKKIYIFDFDNTIAITPDKTHENKTLYEKTTNKSWVGSGRFGRVESLDYHVFDIPLFEPIVDQIKKVSQDKESLSILLTGRMKNFSGVVRAILALHSVPKFDQYYFCDQSTTLHFKLDTLKKIRNLFPHVEEVHFYDDREEHFEDFEKVGNELFSAFTLIKVDAKNNILLC